MRRPLSRDSVSEWTCYTDTMRVGPEEIRESRSLGGFPPGLFCTQKIGDEKIWAERTDER